jgi:hypothetical protein
MSKEERYKQAGGIWQSTPGGINPLYKSAALVDKSQAKMKIQND